MYAGVTTGRMQLGAWDARTPLDQTISVGAEVGSSAPRELSPPTTKLPFAERTGPLHLGEWLRTRGTALFRGTGKRLRSISLDQGVWIAVLALAAVLRFWGLGDKPLHHDESLNAYYSLLFVRLPASYAYDPLFHGPFQFHAEGVVLGALVVLSQLFHTSSAAGTPWINDTTVRLLPASTGVVLVALTYGLRRELGRAGAPAAAFLLAISPTFVYFSRFLREDIYFACFTYATIVCAVQFSRKRTLRWLVALVVSFILAFATKEAIYLSVAICGSFLVGLGAWELGHSVSHRLPARLSARERSFLGHAAPPLLLGAIGSALALLGLHWLNQLSRYINAHTTQTDVQVQHLENLTVVALLCASSAVAVIVVGARLWRIARRHDGEVAASVAPESAPSRSSGRLAATFPAMADGAPTRVSATARPLFWQRGISRLRHRLASLRGRLDAERQPFLWLLLGIPLRYWIVACGVGWLLFVALYWVVPGGAYAPTWVESFGGIGRGIWEGPYYWLEQQQIARGAQPWYYYLLLIPLYEQVAVVFGLAGIIVSLLRPTRFRLFLVYWLVGSLALYSWAGEKMPWLALHILLPLELLAGIALAGLVKQAWRAWALVGRVLVADRRGVRLRWSLPATLRTLPRGTGVALGLLAALALLVPTIHGMLVLTYQDAADGPHEIMVYVQTTPDVQLVMDKIATADRVLYGGTHAMRIGVGPGQEWPFRWYLREYPNTTFNYDVTTVNEPQEDVLILSTAADTISASNGETFMMRHPHGYAMKEYVLRSWWDEAYKPAPCVPAAHKPCPPMGSYPAGSYGVGIGPYLSYGSSPPPDATFQVGLAAGRLWDWLWFRTPLGKVSSGYYDFDFIVHDGDPIRP
jgi:predicted membrane-bound mannosyltransferase